MFNPSEFEFPQQTETPPTTVSTPPLPSGRKSHSGVKVLGVSRSEKASLVHL